MVSVGHASRHGKRAGFGAWRASAALLILTVLAGPVLAAPSPPSGLNDLRCREGAAQTPFQPVLPAARKALRETGKLTIVAIGSSTTAGSGASSEAGSYPAVLQAELRRRLPQNEIRVVNKGVGGQSAYDMMLRIDADVMDDSPSLVIWQTVVNEAIRDVGEDKLARILRKGIGKTQAAGIDLVMMDLQWLARDERYPRYDDYRAVLTKTAQENGVSVFPRYAMMKGWARSQHFSSQELVGMDGTQVVDATYRCLAIRIADGIVQALTGDAAKPTN